MELPLVLDLQFTIQSRRTYIIGTGRTVVMSSREVVFKSERAIPTGTNLTLAIAWPAMLEDRIGLQLMIDGVTTRAERGLTTVSIGRYQFRTRSHAKARRAVGETAAAAIPQARPAVRSWMVGQAQSATGI